MSACEKRGKWELALKLLLQMPTATAVPDEVTFNAGISACEKGGEWQMALHLLSRMPTARLEPDAVSFNAGISACEKCSEWQMALHLLSEMTTARPATGLLLRNLNYGTIININIYIYVQ